MRAGSTDMCWMLAVPSLSFCVPPWSGVVLSDGCGLPRTVNSLSVTVSKVKVHIFAEVPFKCLDFFGLQAV